MTSGMKGGTGSREGKRLLTQVRRGKKCDREDRKSDPQIAKNFKLDFERYGEVVERKEGRKQV